MLPLLRHRSSAEVGSLRTIPLHVKDISKINKQDRLLDCIWLGDGYEAFSNERFESRPDPSAEAIPGPITLARAIVPAIDRVTTLFLTLLMLNMCLSSCMVYLTCLNIHIGERKSL